MDASQGPCDWTALLPLVIIGIGFSILLVTFSGRADYYGISAGLQSSSRRLQITK